MFNLSIRFLRLLGVNRAIGYGVFIRIWGAMAGPVTILLIASRFTEVEQGYYYTFSSLLALQIFFELGLLTVMAQFASHEFVFLSWGESGIVNGDERHRERFFDLLYKGVKWYAISAVLLVSVIVPAGLCFFSMKQQNGADLTWQLPWIFAVIGVAGNLLIIPFNAVITGSGDVAFTNRQQLFGGIAGALISWLVIGFGGGLYAIPAVSSGTIAIGVVFISRNKPDLVKSVWDRFTRKIKDVHHISWWGVVWPMQWKIAISWMSGYFIFQLFTPVLFHYHGAIVAGQMGMTLNAANALLGIGLTWINAQNPELCKLIAVKNWPVLDYLFFKILRQTMTITCAGSIVGWILIWLLQNHYSKIGSRFLPNMEAAILIATTVIIVAIYGLSTYLRAHKREPLMWLSLILAVLQGAVTIILGKYLSSLGVVIGYFSVSLLFSFPSVTLIWLKCRKDWHLSTDT